jgi:N-acetylglucosamine PTS system EIICBA or EIICB component
VVLGPIADQVAGEMRDAAGSRSTEQPIRVTDAKVSSMSALGASALDAAQLVAALGGVRNLRRASANATRLCIDVSDAGVVDDDALRRAGVRSIARLDAHSIHLIVGAAAPATLASLKSV